MPLFDEWCECDVSENDRKRLLRYTEREGGRAGIAGRLPDLVRSHYDDMNRIAEDVAALGYAGAAALLAERLPRTARARSGELGEIFASELVEQALGFTIPVRRLRYKDGREMALRGDDFIGIRLDADGGLALMKGEAKSRANLASRTITDARAALSRDGGRPTATSLLFVADRLMEGDGEGAQLGRTIRNEVANRAVPANRIDHALFTMSGNATPQALAEDLQAAGTDRYQTVIHLRIEDHQEFIRVTYEGALALGNG
ncbi:Hachiman antiphage defense system protein HamA [Rhizobiales bacterium 3FA27D7]|uniref:Hachiman antiphage defense system protein HamA n=1 Tax=Mesorhizobium sp. 2RAF21 TaxID=3232995 RepID=UPI0010F76346